MRPYQTRKSDEVMIVRRGKFLTLLQTALGKHEFQFARQAALIWLANYPGDLLVNFVYASVLAELGDSGMAITNLEKIVRYDPEFTEAFSLLNQLTNSTNSAYASAAAYLERKQAGGGTANWLPAMISARAEYESGNLKNAEKAVLEALAYNPSLPIPTVFHMRVVYQQGNPTLLETLAGIYSSRWPDCVQIKIFSAIADMQQEEDASGVERMHWSAAHDVSGQVVNRLLGPNHPYKPLWPEDLKVYLDLPVPASVAAELGWNVLANSDFIAEDSAEGKAYTPSAEEVLSESPTLASRLPAFIDENSEAAELEYTEIPTASFFNKDIATPLPRSAEDTTYSEIPTSSFFLQEIATPIPEAEIGPPKGKHTTEIPMTRVLYDDEQTRETVTALNDIQKEFEKATRKLNRPDLATADGRFPNYVLLTSKANLVKKYGANTADIVITAMRELSLKIVELPNWNSMVYVPDDEDSAKDAGLSTALATDAWKIKLALTDLDARLSARGEMIGALLIVGGHDIVPFHMLPNPTDDSDVTVPSDNPYATIDENYFIQQWPVGRLPDEAGNDAGYLLEQLRFLNSEYDVKLKSKKSTSNSIFASLIASLAAQFQQFTQRFQHTENLGVSAQVWKTPSAQVFNVIDRGERLVTSPPSETGNLLAAQRTEPKLAYFNLHGLQDAPDWYGQRDLTQAGSSVEYPTAVTPANFKVAASSPEIVLSEACYGAYILGKKSAEALSLNFLATGTRAFVGSTCIAYGGVGKTLVAADLLAYHFWSHIQNEETAGYALMRAKLALATRMTTDQGYLDGEDQKTILSFVLYGDPLASTQNIKQVAKPAIRPTSTPELKTISDSREELVVAAKDMPDEILAKVKQVIRAYLPGLDDATVAINPQLTNFTLDPDLIEAHRAKYDVVKDSQRYVVTLKKTYEYRQKNHNHFARMTFDQRGEMIKLSSSR